MKRIVSGLMLGVASVAGAQQDTTRAAPLQTVIVTADRLRTPLATATAAVTRIPASALLRTPNATLADALRLTPGIALVDFDGMGRDPQLIVRGFYGGGEADYAVVLIDGKPFNQLQTGRITWDALPREESIEAVEIVRGSSSPLWGDAALGGVINIITRRRADANSFRYQASAGTRGQYDLGVDASTNAFGRRAWASASMAGTNGFRDHAKRRGLRSRFGLTFVDLPDAQLSLTTLTAMRRFDDPGPLLDELAAANRRSSDALFRFDETDDDAFTISLDGDRRIGRASRLRGSILGELRGTNTRRTLALAPGFGDTRERDVDAGRALFTTQLELDDVARRGQLVLGAEWSYGRLDSRYYEVASGTRDDYATVTGTRGARSANGDGSRSSGALFAHYGITPVPAVRLSFGARGDWVRDVFDAVEPEPAHHSATHVAFSPKLGVNVRLQESAAAASHLFVAASRSFKAPTLDQLFDQRPIPVPFPPFTLTTSNAGLAPQHGIGYEGGVYHDRVAGANGNLRASVSVYQMDMRDEIDFNVETLGYVNIGRSRHRGLEAGVNWSGARMLSLFGTYTLQDATSRIGEHAGKSLKAIPRHALAAGVGVTPQQRLDVNFSATHSRDIPLDDANEVMLPAFTRVDLQASYPIGRTRVTLSVRNLLNARFSTTGFLDPAGTGQVYYHPAADRTLQFGIRSGL